MSEEPTNNRGSGSQWPAGSIPTNNNNVTLVFTNSSSQPYQQQYVHDINTNLINTELNHTFSTHTSTALNTYTHVNTNRTECHKDTTGSGNEKRRKKNIQSDRHSLYDDKTRRKKDTQQIRHSLTTTQQEER